MNGGNVTAVRTPLPCGLNAPALTLVIRLRMIKDALGLSLSDLSNRTHYSRASWERWLNGKRLISDSALLSFSAAARMNPEPLLRLRALAAQQPLIEGTADTERAAPSCARVRQQAQRRPCLTSRRTIPGADLTEWWTLTCYAVRLPNSQIGMFRGCRGG
jgi:transcriptional regulator with XRE-family HTH domain